MRTYEKQGRYDDAVQAGLGALRNTPHDAGIYEQIAMVYLTRAAIDSGRERWTLEATAYSNKAISADPDNPMIVFDAASVFEKAADLSPAQRCSYYLRAIELSGRLVHLLDSDHVTAGGERYSVDPVRKDFVAHGHTFELKPLKDENERRSEQLRGKSAAAGCRNPSATSQ